MFIKAAKLRAMIASAEAASMRNLHQETDIQRLKHDVSWLKMRIEAMEKAGGITFDTRPRYVVSD